MPAGFGRTDPSAPVITPVDAGDAGRAPEVVVAELQADLAQTTAEEWQQQAREDGFRGIDDL